MQAFMIIALVFAIIIAVFAVQNTAPVSVKFLTFETTQLSLSIVVLLSAAIGAILTFVLGIWRTVRSSMELKSGHKRIAEQDRALQELQAAQARAQESVKQLQRENEQLKARLAERPAAVPPATTAGSSLRQPQAGGTAGPAPLSSTPAQGPAAPQSPERPASPQPTT